jgi:hypothetical protein
MSLRNHFQATLDLPGVLGAFCLNSEGALLESFLPRPYTDAIFKELGPRCLTLLSAVDMSYTRTNEFLLRFEENSLYLHKNEDCILGILCAGNPMLAGLRVSTNLLLKTAGEDIAHAPINELNAPKEVVVETTSATTELNDIIIAPKKQRDEPQESKAAPKRKSLFGFKKDKKTKPSNDIWG